METGIDGVRTLRRRGADGWLLVVVAHLLLLLAPPGSRWFLAAIGAGAAGLCLRCGGLGDLVGVGSGGFYIAEFALFQTASRTWVHGPDWWGRVTRLPGPGFAAARTCLPAALVTRTRRAGRVHLLLLFANVGRST